MSRVKASAPSGRVWRISDSAPMGEWVDKSTPVAHQHPDALPEVVYGSWVTSSYDLLDGADVIEGPDTLPGELLDEIFALRPTTATPPRK